MIDWPLNSNRIRRGKLSNTFGMVRRNMVGMKKPHQGWDFAAPIGTPCYAVATGRIMALYEGGDYGKVLVLEFRDAGRRLYAAYCHLSAYHVKLGEPVNQGEMIGFTGESGNARGMAREDQHLHFEIRTEPRPGKGLARRLSPMELYGHCPLHSAVPRRGKP